MFATDKKNYIQRFLNRLNVFYFKFSWAEWTFKSDIGYGVTHIHSCLRQGSFFYGSHFSSCLPLRKMILGSLFLKTNQIILQLGKVVIILRRKMTPGHYSTGVIIFLYTGAMNPNVNNTAYWKCNSGNKIANKIQLTAILYYWVLTLTQ